MSRRRRKPPPEETSSSSSFTTTSSDSVSDDEESGSSFESESEEESEGETSDEEAENLSSSSHRRPPAVNRGTRPKKPGCGRTRGHPPTIDPSRPHRAHRRRSTRLVIPSSAPIDLNRNRAVRGSFFYRPGDDLEWQVDPSEWEYDEPTSGPSSSGDSPADQVPATRRFGARPLRQYPILGGLEYIKINKDMPDKFKYPLHWLCYSGDIGHIDRLTTKGVDLNVTDLLNRLPLHYACLMGHKEVVYYLLRRGDVKIDSCDHVGFSPLALSAFCGFPEIVRMFLSRGSCNEMRVVMTKQTTRSTASTPRELPSLCQTAATRLAFVTSREESAKFCTLVDSIGGEHKSATIPRNLKRIIRKGINVNCRVIDTLTKRNNIRPLEIACQRMGNEKGVQYLLHHHARPTPKLASEYPEYRLVLDRWCSYYAREKLIRQLIRTEKSFCEDIIIISREIGKSISVWAQFQIRDVHKKRLFSRMNDALAEMNKGHCYLRFQLQKLIPLLNVWNPFRSGYKHPVVSDVDDEDIESLGKENPVLGTLNFAPGDTWFDQAKVMKAFEVYLPFEAYKAYGAVVSSFERLLMSGEHDDLRAFVEQLAQNRKVSVKTVHGVLMKPLDYLSSTRRALKKLLRKTDVIVDADVYEHTKHAHDRFVEYLEEMKRVLTIVRSKHGRQDDLKTAETQLRTTYKTTLEKLLGRREAAECTELVWFGSRNDLKYVDIVEVQVADDRYPRGTGVNSLRGRARIPQKGMCDIFVFPAVVAFGANGKLCRFGMKTKVIFRWRHQSFRISVYGGENLQEVIMVREILCPRDKKGMAREFYECIFSLPHVSDPINGRGPIPADARWLSLPHFDDDEHIAKFLRIWGQS